MTLFHFCRFFDTLWQLLEGLPDFQWSSCSQIHFWWYKRFWLIFETFQKISVVFWRSLKRLPDLAICEDFWLFLKVLGHFSKRQSQFWTKLFYFLIFQVTISKKSKLWWNRIAPNSKIDFPKMNLFLAKMTTQLFIFTSMTLNPLCGS